MRILAIAASHRQSSLNKKLISLTTKELQSLSHDIVTMSFERYDVPLFYGDYNIEPNFTFPQGVINLNNDLSKCDCLVISTPEYNHSITGVLKNLLDWLSCMQKHNLMHKPVLLLSASPSDGGGRAGLWQTRIPFESIHAYVYPEMFGLSLAHKAFADDGNFLDPKLASRFQKLLKNFTHFAQKQEPPQ